MAAPVDAVEVVGHEDARATVRALLLQPLHLAGVVNLQIGSRSGCSTTTQPRVECATYQMPNPNSRLTRWQHMT